VSRRFYMVQYNHWQRNWTNLPSLASQMRLRAERDAKSFAEQHTVLTRVIRMPKGWVPPPPSEPIPQLKLAMKVVSIPPKPPKSEGEKVESPSCSSTNADPQRLWAEAQRGDQGAALALARIWARRGRKQDLIELGILAYYSRWGSVLRVLAGPVGSSLRKWAKESQDWDMYKNLEDF
jgi:hypothetical protein